MMVIFFNIGKLTILTQIIFYSSHVEKKKTYSMRTDQMELWMLPREDGERGAGHLIKTNKTNNSLLQNTTSQYGELLAYFLMLLKCSIGFLQIYVNDTNVGFILAY